MEQHIVTILVSGEFTREWFAAHAIICRQKKECFVVQTSTAYFKYFHFMSDHIYKGGDKAIV